MLKTRTKYAPRITIGFDAHARTVSLNVRRSLAAVFAYLDVDPNKPRLLARQMEWGLNLAWKISHVVTGDELFSVIPLLPGKPGQRILLESFQKVGAPVDLVNAVRDALAEFEAMVATHAGDRDTFQKMLVELTEVGQADREEARRKLAFQGSSAYWGVQAKARLSCNIIRPGSSPGRLDWAMFGGLLDFRRLRSDIEWTIGLAGAVTDLGREISMRESEPLDRSITDPHAPPIVRMFSSESLPLLHAVPGPNFSTLFRIQGGEVGTTGQFTCLMGSIHRGVLQEWAGSIPREGIMPEESRENEFTEYQVIINTPVEILHFDIFMPKTFAEDLEPTINMFSLLPGEPAVPILEQKPLPLSEKLSMLQTDPLDVTASDIPQYPRMVEWMFDRVGANPADYVGFRFRLRYPMLSTKMTFRHWIPKKS